MEKLYEDYVPERFKGRTGCQIFVDRFFRDGSPVEPMQGRILKEWNDFVPNWWPDADGEYRNLYFYGGNLKGIISKMDYLDSMGFDLLYLSPISYTQTSHHYDVGDQRIIDPWIGTWEDFKELCNVAHSKGKLICVDLVFNHMGINSKFFQEALKNPNSRFHQWFEWDDNGKPIFWFGFKDLPQCNKNNKDYQEYVFSVCEFYLKMGADGIRLDLGENFPAEFMRRLRKRIKEIDPETLIVSEMWDLAIHKENPQIYGDQVDSVMNYPFSDAICRWQRYGNEGHLEYTWNELSKYPKAVRSVLWNFIDTHDTPRAMNMLAAEGMLQNPFVGRIWDIEGPWRKPEGFDTFGFRQWEANMDSNFDLELARKRLILASVLQYFEEGIPIVYYGTELAMTGYKDPHNRKPYPWDEYPILFDHYRGLGIFRRNHKDILKDAETVKSVVSPFTLLKARKNENGTLILTMNGSNMERENPAKSFNTEGWQEIYQIGEGTKSVLGPYSVIVYRANN